MRTGTPIFASELDKCRGHAAAGALDGEAAAEQRVPPPASCSSAAEPTADVRGYSGRLRDCAGVGTAIALVVSAVFRQKMRSRSTSAGYTSGERVFGQPPGPGPEDGENRKELPLRQGGGRKERASYMQSRQRACGRPRHPQRGAGWRRHGRRRRVEVFSGSTRDGVARRYRALAADGAAVRGPDALRCDVPRREGIPVLARAPRWRPPTLSIPPAVRPHGAFAYAKYVLPRAIARKS